MPTTPAELFRAVGLTLSASVPWGELPDSKAPGVYAISLCPDPGCNGNLRPIAPLELEKVTAWIRRVPSFSYRGITGPQPSDVAAFLASFWLADESVVYIGKATALRTRLCAYRGHVLGDRSPHAGGHWIKTFSNLTKLYIHFCIASSREVAEAKEDEALSFFKSRVSSLHRERLGNPIPFANRAHPQGSSKQVEIRGDVLR